MSLGTCPTNDLSYFKGEDITIPFVVGSDLSTDITGWTIVYTLKNNDDSPTLTITVNGTVTDGPNRLFQIVIPAATSATITVASTHKYDVWRTDVGYKWVLSTGTQVCKTERRVATP